MLLKSFETIPKVLYCRNKRLRLKNSPIPQSSSCNPLLAEYIWLKKKLFTKISRALENLREFAFNFSTQQTSWVCAGQIFQIHNREISCFWCNKYLYSPESRILYKYSLKVVYPLHRRWSRVVANHKVSLKIYYLFFHLLKIMYGKLRFIHSVL